MKKLIILVATIVGTLSLATSCIEETFPQNSPITGEQADNAPGAFDNFVGSLTSTLAGQFTYGGDDYDAYDYGYSTFFLMRDVMGQDMVPTTTSGTEWYGSWYSYDVTLGPSYAHSQMPWTYYYGWIKNCNIVITMAGEEPNDARKNGAGIAYAMRALFYMDLARMYASKTYAVDKAAETVPYVTEKTSLTDLTNNPRATNEEMWGYILADLDKAENFLKGYTRSDKYTPDLSVVYGLKARAYQTMEDWSNAEKYAKLAMNGYTMLTPTEYISRETGFNTPNNAWMFALRFKSDDPNIKFNDGDSSWGSWMILEVKGAGYASNYGAPKQIDRHLYETINATDCRKQCFVDFSLNEMEEEDAKTALKNYSAYPDRIWAAAGASEAKTLGGLSLKFRANGGTAGRENQYVGFSVSVPLMRVEEMKLIEAEAVGMQAGREAEGIALLTAFAKQRDEQYTYGTHNEAYGNSSTSAFQNEVWWQRRVEFWGEGLAMFDTKRLNKGVIRSYAGSNHPNGYRWNSTSVPEAMNWCISQSETNFNKACTNNPAPSQPTDDSPEFVW